MRRFALVALIGILAGGSGYWLSRLRHAALDAPNQESDPQSALNALLNLTLPAIDGRLVRMSDWRGNVLVINYWATWCPPCREEMPVFSALQLKYADKGVQFAGISIDSVDKIQQFNADKKIAYPLLIGDMATLGMAVALGNKAQGLPFTIVVNRQGGIDSVKLGPLSETELEQRLLTLLHQ